MTIVTTYTCDKCGHSQEEKEQMWTVGVSVTHLDSSHWYGNINTLNPKALWCQDCVEGLGLLLPSTKPDAPAPPLVTLETIVRELIQEEMEP